MRTVTPCFFSIASGQISPTYDSIEWLPLMILLLSSLSVSKGKLTILPEFRPTPFMLEKYKKIGEPWQIFAWCVRDVMSKYSGIPTLETKLGFQDKVNYCALMNCRVDEIEINGTTYSYRFDRPTYH